MTFANKKAQIIGTTKKAVAVPGRIIGARAGVTCRAVCKLGSGYSLQARPTLIAQTARFRKFTLRDGLLRCKAGRRGRGARVFHAGLLRGMLFGRLAGYFGEEDAHDPDRCGAGAWLAVQGS